MIKPSKVSQTLRVLAVGKARELLSRDLPELMSLPEWTVEHVETEIGKAVVGIHHTKGIAGEQFVVQASSSRAFGIFTAIEVDGFVIEATGVRRLLLEQETWDYI